MKLRMLLRAQCLTLLLLSLFSIFTGAWSADLTGPQILDILRARDEQFDNANLQYKEYSESPIPGEIIRTMSMEERKNLPPGGVIQHVFDRQLVVRDRETTINSKPDPSIFEINPPGFGFNPFSRKTNIGGNYRDYVEQNDGYRDLTIRPSGQDRDMLYQTRMYLEFSLGFGFGKRITEIQSVERTAGGYVLKGLIEPYLIAASPFEIEIDDDFVVRLATVTMKGSGDDEVVFDIQTEGSDKDGPLVFAEKGHFEKAILRPGEDGGEKTKTVSEKFSIDFGGINWDLTDAEYADLTEIPLTPGLRVRDFILGMNYTIGDDPGEKLNVIEHGKGDFPASVASEDSTTTTVAQAGDADVGEPVQNPSEDPVKSGDSRAMVYFIFVILGVTAASYLVLVARRMKKGGVNE